MTEDQARDSALMGLASLTSAAIGLENSEALKRLPEQLATSGEACAHLRCYFRGGVPELREKLEAAQRGLDAVRAVVGSIEKPLW